MLKANIVMNDGTKLNEVMLFENKKLGDSIISTREKAEAYLETNAINVHFSGSCVQGILIPECIKEYELIDDFEDVEKRIKEFVKSNNSIYDTNDTAEYILEYREQLLKLLK